MAFKVGDKVVCVDDSGIRINVIYGEEYTVSVTCIEGGIRLVELEYEPLNQYYSVKRFRKAGLDYEFVDEVLRSVTSKKAGI